MSRLLNDYNNLITSRFGMRTLNGHTSQHNGIDIVGDGGNGVGRVTEIKAHTSGTVTAQGFDNSAGNYVQIDCGGNVTMVYYHMKNDTVRVRKGDKVKKGDIIGFMGATGNVTGSHLHFGIKDNGKWVDPEPYLEADYPKASDNSGDGTIKAGDKLNLNSEPSYSSAASKNVAGYRTGTYYVWSAEVVNGRIRITNHPSRVGVKGQVTCWIDAPAPAYRTYTIKKGDTLWGIASRELGKGSRFTEIIKLNGLKGTIIYAGKQLKLPKK